MWFVPKCMTKDQISQFFVFSRCAWFSNHSLTLKASETGAYSPKYLSISDRIPLKSDRFDGESPMWHPVEYSGVPNTSRKGHWGNNYVFLTNPIFADHCINQKPCESRDLLRVRTTLPMHYQTTSGDSQDPIWTLGVHGVGTLSSNRETLHLDSN